MRLTIKPFEYQDGETTCVGQVAWDESYVNPKPAVLINHAWGGLDEFAKDWAIKMAALGYIGIALDNYGNGVTPETVDDKMEKMTPFTEDRAKLLQRLKAGYDAAAAMDIVDESHMAVLGFCFGGLCTLDMARAGLDLKAAISFHGLLDAPRLPKNKIKADVLVCHGWDDPMAPPETVVAVGAELREAECDWTLMAFGNTKHAFMVPEADNDDLGLKYNQTAEKQAWSACQDLLSKHFAMHGVDQEPSA